MRNAQMLFGLLLGASAAIAGCTKSDAGDQGVAPEGTSQARIVASSHGGGEATLHLTAVAAGTSSVAVDKTIDLDGGPATVLDLGLPPAMYTFTADVLSGGVSLGTSTAQVDMKDGVTTQIMLAADVGPAAESGESAAVQFGVDVAPQITSVEVRSSGGAGSAATTVVQVSATDADGGGLTFFWSGAGLIEGALKGSSTLVLSTSVVTAAASTSPPVLHVVVQDAKGVAATADIALTVAAAGVKGSMSSSAGGDVTLQACLDAQAQCNAACTPGLAVGALGVTADASCLTGCGVSLLACEGK